tara:strand:+ start:643 stop:819 length:177 start_codon:yes stop_codon:yes gene_type:complete
MRTKADRRARHINAAKANTSKTANKGVHKDKIIQSKGKAYKVIQAGKKEYFLELKVTK